VRKRWVQGIALGHHARIRSHSLIGPRRPFGLPDHDATARPFPISSNPTRRPRRVLPFTRLLRDQLKSSLRWTRASFKPA